MTSHGRAFNLLVPSVALNDLERIKTADLRYLCGSWASCWRWM